ncbi:MAG: hypothetical protein KAW45_05050 [Thermoplasmatales archaeon]|nr:hypothetical protein [Thermoplasmatales archaeon]
MHPFEIHDFGKEALKESLKNEHVLDRKFSSRRYNKHFEYIYDYLTDLGCQLILVENFYTDRDYLIDFANYYVRCFEKYDRLCKRLHFFKEKFDEKKFISLLKNEKANLQKIYLGFIVAKPLPEAIFGRTILETYPTEKTGRHFPTIRKYGITLFGKNMEKFSLAFQEQDTVTAACATCALWSAFQKTAKIFDRSWSPTPIEITKAATKFQIYTRPIPSRGLKIEQMCQAIREIGLDLHVVDIEEIIAQTDRMVPLQSLIYSYLYMGIPVIMGGAFIGQGVEGGHAVAITGYHLCDSPYVDREVPDDPNIRYCNLKGRKIDKFYAHDDQVGPFCKIEIETGRYPIRFHTNPNVQSQVWQSIIPAVLIIPLYEKIRIVFMDVYRWILKFNIFIEKLEIIPKRHLEWDIYLTETNIFKNEFLENKEYNLFGFDVLLERMPRYIWRCCAEADGKKIVEIVADATDMPRSFFLTNIFFFDEKLRIALKSKMQIDEIRKKSDEYLTEHFTKLIIDNL